MHEPTTLLVTQDPAVTDEALRLAAAAGMRVEVVGDPGTAEASWTGAAAVLVGTDRLADLAGRPMPRREHVYVVALGRVDDTVLHAALAVGAASVAALPEHETRLVQMLSEAADGTPDRAATLAVTGGSGGCGATTLAAAVCVAATRRGLQVTLLDLDLLGAGAAPVVGVDAETGMTWRDIAGSAGRISATSLREVLPTRDGLAVLSPGPASPASLRDLDGAAPPQWQPPTPSTQPAIDPQLALEVLSAARRGCDLVVVDLPRWQADTHQGLLRRCDVCLLVAAMRLSGVAAAGRLSMRIRATCETALVARVVGYGVEPERAASVLELPLLTRLPDQRRLEESVALGLGPLRSARGPLARAASRVLAAVLGPGGAGR